MDDLPDFDFRDSAAEPFNDLNGKFRNKIKYARSEMAVLIKFSLDSFIKTTSRYFPQNCSCRLSGGRFYKTICLCDEPVQIR